MLSALLLEGLVLGHSFVTGEIALGTIRQRDRVLTYIDRLPQAPIVMPQEVRAFIERRKLSGLGIGYVDVHLLAAVRLVPNATLWTRDQRLASVAEQLSLAFRPS